MRITVRDNFTEQLAVALADRTDKAKHILAQQIRNDTEQYVPMLTGSLSQRTRVVGNTIIYPGPYARFLYYGKVMIDPETGSAWARSGAKKVVTDRPLTYTQTYHKNAGPYWFERSKAQNLEKWLRVAKKAVSTGHE